MLVLQCVPCLYTNGLKKGIRLPVAECDQSCCMLFLLPLTGLNGMKI